MNSLLFQFYFIQILGVLMCGAQKLTTSQNGYDNSKALVSVTTSASASMPKTTSLMTTQPKKSITQAPRPNATRTRATPTPTPTPKATTSTLFDLIFNGKECFPVLMVTGGLIIACTILLISTLLLAWKVCQLSRRIKALSSNAELISNSEYWMENAKKNKSKSETEPKETSVLMADLSQTEEETGTAKEEGGKENEDGQMGEENKKEVGDSTSNPETSTTPVAAAENSSKPQEEVTDSQPTKAEEASTSEGEKDVV